jgi:hypothetical protein
MLVGLGSIPLIVDLKPHASIPLWYCALLTISVMLGTAMRVTYSDPLNLLLCRRVSFGTQSIDRWADGAR